MTGVSSAASRHPDLPDIEPIYKVTILARGRTGGHADPWNHVEAAMALLVGGRRADAERAFEWLVAKQRDDGSWHNYYVGDLNRGRVLAAKTPFVYARVNFQPSAAPTFPGYLVDGGAAFGARGNGFTYGWNVDNAANTRDRNSTASPDQRYDTFNLLNPGKTGAVWEIAVPNGNYSVHVVAGDPLDQGNVYRIGAERSTIIDGRSTARRHWGMTSTVHRRWHPCSTD